MTRIQLLLVFIHGFKGDHTTFEGFPDRLQQVLTNSLLSVDVSTVVYPQYETRGELTVAVDHLCRWLFAQAKEHRQRGTGDVCVCLIGHSMGGLLAADALRQLHHKTDTADAAKDDTADAPAPPPILAVLAYDTPYYGLCTSFISRTALSHATEWGGHLSSVAKIAGSVLPAAKLFAGSRWKAAAAGGSLLAAAAASAVYVHRDRVRDGINWVTDHLLFAGALLHNDQLSQRVTAVCSDASTVFRCYYNVLRNETDPGHSQGQPKTFIQLPPSAYAQHFIPVASTAKDEIDAHTTMFNDANPSFYGLGNQTISVISEAVRAHLNKHKEK